MKTCQNCNCILKFRDLCLEVTKKQVCFAPFLYLLVISIFLGCHIHELTLRKPQRLQYGVLRPESIVSKIFATSVCPVQHALANHLYNVHMFMFLDL